jgi:hypothetical protein
VFCIYIYAVDVADDFSGRELEYLTDCASDLLQSYLFCVIPAPTKPRLGVLIEDFKQALRRDASPRKYGSHLSVVCVTVLSCGESMLQSAAVSARRGAAAGTGPSGGRAGEGTKRLGESWTCS